MDASQPLLRAPASAGLLRIGIYLCPTELTFVRRVAFRLRMLLIHRLRLSLDSQQMIQLSDRTDRFLDIVTKRNALDRFYRVSVLNPKLEVFRSGVQRDVIRHHREVTRRDVVLVDASSYRPLEHREQHVRSE